MRTDMNVPSDDVVKYHEFCEQHGLRPYSMIDLAFRMNLTMRKLRFSLSGMIDYFPQEFKAFHRKEEAALAQESR